MHISLDEAQLANLETMFNKITQSFEKFSENIKELIIAIEKLTKEIKNQGYKGKSKTSEGQRS